MPSEPYRAPQSPSPEHWERVGSAHEAKAWEVEETAQRPMAALDYDRAQEERWAKLSPRLIEALDKLFGPQPILEPLPAPVFDTPSPFDYEGLAELYGQDLFHW